MMSPYSIRGRVGVNFRRSAVALSAVLFAALPLPARAALSSTYAALFNNAAGAAAKVVTLDNLRAYATKQLAGSDIGLIVGILNDGRFKGRGLQLRLTAMVAVTTAIASPA